MREYLLVLLVAAATSFLLTGWCRRLAMRVGAYAAVRDRDVHAVPIPYFGGIAMLGGVAVAFVLASQLPFLGRYLVVSHDSMAILLGGTVICAVGVLDDLVELSAIAKIAGQVLAAGIVVLNGVKIFWIPLPDSIIALDDASAIVVTVVFIFVCVNAINLIDGLDGLAAGVTAIGALAFLSYAYLLSYELNLVRATTASLVTAATAGACLGFLPHNFSPARIFMGDSGALLLGFLLATSSISLTGQIDSSGLAAGGNLLPSYLPLILPIAIMFLPFLDLVLAYVRRTWAGKLWYVADRQHLHHRLLERGHSTRRAVIIMYLWSAVMSFGVIAIALSGGAMWVAVGGVLAAMAALAVLTVAPGTQLWRGDKPRRLVPPDR